MAEFKDFLIQLLPDSALVDDLRSGLAKLTGISVQPARPAVVLHLSLSGLLPVAKVIAVEEALEEALGVSEVILSQRLQDNWPTDQCDRYIHDALPWLMRHCVRQATLESELVRDMPLLVADQRVTFSLPEHSCQLLEATERNWFEDFWRTHAAVPCRFDFEVDQTGDPVSELLQQRALELEKASAELRAQAESQKKARRGKRTAGDASLPNRSRSKSPNAVWGRPFAGLDELTPIAKINHELDIVLIQGDLLDYTERVIPSGNSLIKFGITDFESSIPCVMFVKPEVADDLRQILPDGHFRLAGRVEYDNYNQERQLKVTYIEKVERAPERTDAANIKRVELHAHTKMSAKDATIEAADLVRQAAAFGHEAVAVTDHGVVQSFPQAADAAARLRREGQTIKLIYGMEGYLVDDGPAAVWYQGNGSLTSGFVALDLETTGLSPEDDRIIEVTAVRYLPDESGSFVEDMVFHSLVNPGRPLSRQIKDLTGLDDADLAEAPDELTVLAQLQEFIEALPLVGHNVFFDLDMMRCAGFRQPASEPRLKFNPPLVDTLVLARILQPELKSHKLSDVAAALQIPQAARHRATDDARTAAAVFLHHWQQNNWQSLRDLDRQLGRLDAEQLRQKGHRNYHIVLLAANDLGLYNLYRLVSLSHLDYFYYRPRIPRSWLQYFRAGLILGAACIAGEVFSGVLDHYTACGNDLGLAIKRLPETDLIRRARKYDYLEIQPLTNNSFLLNEETSAIRTEEDLKNLNRLVIALAKLAKRPVCATCDAHFLTPRDGIYREILQSDMGFAEREEAADLYFRTTEEMLDAFAYLGPELAERVVIDNPRAIAAQIDAEMKPFPAGSFPPMIKEADEQVKSLTWQRAQALYGRDGILPDLILQRVEKELSSIIDNGFAVMYFIAQAVVKKSNDDGYIVGSRGSVGSSLVATLCGITEVNPLPPHYVCPACHFTEFDQTGAYGSGFDLPQKSCPACATEMHRDGQDIPFETFLGFDGNKQPDIDLNFSGEYQAAAHQFIEEMFGSDYTFRAGTISSYAAKNSAAMVLNYFEKQGQKPPSSEVLRLSRGLNGIKRTTGQHPGGIVVVPKEREIYDFTPIQHPADRRETGIITTHFDFNAMHDTILKLDILGHDDPSMLRMLSDLTGVDVMTIPVPDERVMQLFQSTEPLGIPDAASAIGSATIGLPELGTMIVREMIRETKPSRFYDLVQLSGLSHGTDVWIGNAQELIRNGICTIHEVIGCRDSIMTSLIYAGLPPKSAFDIMERVRKGGGLTDEQEALMREHQVPDWYIESCKKIRYMFPKAHAAAYIISALRIAWFKVYHPESYYCAYFTVRATEFDSSEMCLDAARIRQKRRELHGTFSSMNDREQKRFYILELVEEMQQRGIDFLPLSLEHSAATHFVSPEPGLIRPPLNAIPGISSAMANNIVKARETSPIRNHDDLMRRGQIGQSAVDNLLAADALGDLPVSAQMDLFSLLGSADAL